VLRAVFLLVVSAMVAAVISSYGIIRDYGTFRASVLTGSSGGAYYNLASRLAERAKRDGGRLDVIATAGSIENIARLSGGRARCAEKFAFIQDGAPVPAGSGLELLGRLPAPESLLLLQRGDHRFADFASLRGASFGIGPEGSGSAYLMRQLISDPDLAGLDIHLSYHPLEEQARLVARGDLDVAAFVMRDDAEFLRTIIREYDLDIADLQDLQGLVGRYEWMSLGKVPAGRYDLVRQIPATDKIVPQINTLVAANACAKRADRIELLSLLSAELSGFVRANPPTSTSSATILPLSGEARQYFIAGEPEFADRYFPWLVNLMSPAYWVYLVMAATALFNALRGLSHFRLWRLDAAREKLELEIRELTGEIVTHAPNQEILKPSRIESATTHSAQAILDRLMILRARCRTYANSFATPMGDEMYYRYQQSLIDQTALILKPFILSTSGSA
jgi:TRAP-type uncharacterized transport system substrate-binding protein